MKSFKLIPDLTGDIMIYDKFWKNNSSSRTAPPLLVYADLLSTGDQRCIETANIIYDKYLQNQFS